MRLLVVVVVVFVCLQCLPANYYNMVTAVALPHDVISYYNNNNNVVRALRSRDSATVKTSWSRDSSPERLGVTVESSPELQKLRSRDLTSDSAFTRQSRSAPSGERARSILFAAATWPLLDSIEQSQINDVISDTILAKYQSRLVAEPASDGTSEGDHNVDGWSSGFPKSADKTWWSASVDDNLSQPMVHHSNSAHTPLLQTSKRTFGQLRTPRELHPVYLGLGQSAASAALNTYASLLADDKRRESLEQQATGNPVRFIGRR